MNHDKSIIIWKICVICVIIAKRYVPLLFNMPRWGD